MLLLCEACRQADETYNHSKMNPIAEIAIVGIISLAALSYLIYKGVQRFRGGKACGGCGGGCGSAGDRASLSSGEVKSATLTIGGTPLGKQ